MRAIFMILFLAFGLFGYEIDHENPGKFYKFDGVADGAKFEIYLSYFENEFENFKPSENFQIPPKISGHAFFNGAKFDFDKGKMEQNGTKISALCVQSEWLNLDVKAQGEELAGKIIIKNKAYKAALKQAANYEILALGVQLVQDGKRFDAIVSDYFSAKFSKKYKNELKSQLDTLKQTWLAKDADSASVSQNLEPFYQNDKIKNLCLTKNKTLKICDLISQKTQKKIKLNQIFKDLNDENLKQIFAKFDVKTDIIFTLSPIGLTFYDEGEKSVPLDAIKPFLSENFGLF